METIVRKSGLRYREMIYINGRLTKSPSFKRKIDAKNWKIRMEGEKLKALSLGEEFQRKDPTTFGLFVVDWLENTVKVNTKPSTYQSYTQTVVKHFLPIFESTLLHKITEKEVNKLVSKLKKDHKPNGINKIIRVLKTILLDAEKKEIIVKSPLRHYKKLKVEQTHYDYWEKSEIKQFLDANSQSRFYHLYVLALNTGMRKGELNALTWKQINFEKKIIQVSQSIDKSKRVASTKTSKWRIVPINDSVLNSLLGIKRNSTSEFVFSSKNNSFADFHHLYEVFKKDQLKADMPRLINFHKLRHTFASQFMMGGGNIYDLQKILGHSDIRTTEMYAHLSPSHLAKTTSILNFS